MKIPKVSHALAILALEAEARDPEVGRGLRVESRGLQSSASCSYPCSMGSCDWDNQDPWDSVGNEEDDYQYPFKFVLEEGVSYNIEMKRDQDQCAMKLSNWDVYDENGDSLSGDRVSLTDSCDSDPGYAGLENAIPAKTGTYTVRLLMETAGGSGCPREGFKYSIKVDPPPKEFEIDDSCALQQRAFVGGNGQFTANHTRNVVVPQPTSFEIDIEHRYDDALTTPRGKLDTSYGERKRAILLEVDDLTFYDTSLDWLFINDKCARFQGRGTVRVDGEVAEKDAFFDTIVFNNGDEPDTFQMQINKTDRTPALGDYYWYEVTDPAELEDGDILALADVGDDNQPPAAFPMGKCEGDCDSDYDCEGELVCFTRDKYEGIPNCWDKDGGGKKGNDYCTVRPARNYLQTPSLGLCQGDCDADSDCEPGLVCFQRSGYAPVPGCEGDGKRNQDYCVLEEIQCLLADMYPFGDRYPDLEGSISICFNQALSDTSGELEMAVDGLGVDTVGGVHVHTGRGCAEVALQGGHYFNGSGTGGIKGNGDPWFNPPSDIAPTGAGYVTDSDGTGTAGFLFDQGYGYGDTRGRAVIIHDTIKALGGDYARVACGILVEEIRCLRAEMSPFGGRYPDLEGSISICFNRALSDTSGELRMTVDGLGVDTVGGVHVHTGTACADAALQGGHFFNGSGTGGIKGDGDPWFNTPSDIAPDGAGYVTDGDGTGTADFLFDQGYGYGDTKGRAVIIHDTIKALGGDYARVACGILKAA